MLDKFKEKLLDAIIEFLTHAEISKSEIEKNLSKKNAPQKTDFIKLVEPFILEVNKRGNQGNEILSASTLYYQIYKAKEAKFSTEVLRVICEVCEMDANYWLDIEQNPNVVKFSSYFLGEVIHDGQLPRQFYLLETYHKALARPDLLRIVYRQIRNITKSLKHLLETKQYAKYLKQNCSMIHYSDVTGNRKLRDELIDNGINSIMRLRGIKWSERKYEEYYELMIVDGFYCCDRFWSAIKEGKPNNNRMFHENGIGKGTGQLGRIEKLISDIEKNTEKNEVLMRYAKILYFLTCIFLAYSYIEEAKDKSKDVNKLLEAARGWLDLAKNQMGKDKITIESFTIRYHWINSAYHHAIGEHKLAVAELQKAIEISHINEEHQWMNYVNIAQVYLANAKEQNELKDKMTEMRHAEHYIQRVAGSSSDLSKHIKVSFNTLLREAIKSNRLGNEYIEPINSSGYSSPDKTFKTLQIVHLLQAQHLQLIFAVICLESRLGLGLNNMDEITEEKNKLTQITVDIQKDIEKYQSERNRVK